MYGFNAVASSLLICCTGAAVLAAMVPSLNSFLAYGKTRKRDRLASRTFIDTLSDITVPKSWFSDFYPLLVILIHIKIYIEGSIDLRETLLIVQGVRRSLEQAFTFQHTPTSRMHLSHYVVGLAFYTIQALSQVNVRAGIASGWWIGFLLVSYYQHICHKALGSTQKYNMPSFPIVGRSRFLSTACPHYGAEIILYVILFGIVEFNLYDSGFYVCLCSLIWVVVSLCIAGENCRRYYISPKNSKNRQEDIRWAVLPFLY